MTADVVAARPVLPDTPGCLKMGRDSPSMWPDCRAKTIVSRRLCTFSIFVVGLSDAECSGPAESAAMSPSSGCPEIDPDSAEARGTRLLGCIAKDVSSPRDLELLESYGGDRRLELCFQQSAGDSAGP
jgi:hypothetical protein